MDRAKVKAVMWNVFIRLTVGIIGLFCFSALLVGATFIPEYIFTIIWAVVALYVLAFCLDGWSRLGNDINERQWVGLLLSLGIVLISATFFYKGATVRSLVDAICFSAAFPVLIRDLFFAGPVHLPQQPSK